MEDKARVMEEKPRVMVVDDDLAMCGFLSTFLGTRGYSALTVTNGNDAVRRFFTDRPAAVLLDIVMAGNMDGLAALAAFKKIDKDVPVIVVSGQSGTRTAVEAMKLGAADFVCKPFEDAELEARLGHALKQRHLEEIDLAAAESSASHAHYPLLFEHSAGMEEVGRLVDRLADTDVTILIHGESGTGKELVARVLHERSLRADKPFVKVHCASLPTELFESELFGFEQGAFAGAIQRKPGKLESANHGTIFFDEIGDMSPSLQAKLLQVVQRGEFSRLGGSDEVRVDVRVIAATTRDIEAAVADGEFREDLYCRLNVVTISLPPLRERREQIPYLIDYFLKKYSEAYHKRVVPLSADLARQFMQYDWPGNVRQLENLIKRRVALGSDAPILNELRPASPRFTLRSRRAYRQEPDEPASSRTRAAAWTEPDEPEAPAGVSSPAEVDVDTPAPSPSGRVSLKAIARSAAREAERELILRTLTQTRWNRKEAAARLGICYKALLYKIKENGLGKAS